MNPPLGPTQPVVGVSFYVGDLDGAVRATLAGGLVVAPSGPGLAVDLVVSPSYRRAVTTADLAITDSGWMILLWRARTGQRLPRHSGLKLIRALLEVPELKAPGAVFWVMPSAAEDARNRGWLNENGFNVTDADVYLAPFYGKGDIEDPALVSKIEARKPKLVMLCIGGGVQERVGLMLRDKLSIRPGIACLGAAIAFLTGGQAPIPVWADKLFLGWLMRILHSPRKFWRRYYEALRLAPLVLRYKDRLPPLRA